MAHKKLIKVIFGNMSKCYKRYEFWGSENGKPIKKFTPWFKWDSDICPKYQLERHPKLLNEYKDE